MTGVIINNNFYDISTGNTKIEYNSMGNGTLSYSMYGNEIPVSIEKIRQFIINSSTSWILDTDGTLWGCGYNNQGQQGSGNTTSVKSFTQRMTDVKKVIANDTVTWIIKNDGTLWGCGYNNQGQQGSGNTTNVTTFTQRLTDVKDIILSNYDYRATTWALKTDGTLWGCGNNDYGQQGSGTSGSNAKIMTFIQRLTDVEKVFVSTETTWAIKTDGTLWGCGSNSYGQQGISPTGDANIKTFTQRLTDVEKVFVNNSDPNQHETWVLKTDKTLWGCGDNQCGQQGNGESGSGKKVTTFTQRLTNVKDVYVRTNYINVLKTDGTLWLCGQNSYGEQGSGDTTNVTTFTQRLTDVEKIISDNSKSSLYATIALKTDGTLWGCGDASKGIIPSSNNKIFTQIATNVKDFNYGYSYLWVLKTDGTLWGCGQRAYGQQGDGYTYGTDSYITTLTQRLTDVSSFIVAYGVWAFKSNDDVYRTGNNDNGQKGEGNTTTIGTFTKLSFRES